MVDMSALPAKDQSGFLADYLIAECRDRGENLTPLKLQKLMYYADAWHLALYDTEITTEEFQAWAHGPVAVSQYDRFREFAWKPITTNVKRPILSEALTSHLNEIIDVFGSESAVALELMTHQELPWIEARGDTPAHERSRNPISKQTTKNYYKNLGEDKKA